MRPLKAVIVILCFLASNFLFAQNNLCANATPFCTGQTMTFPAGVNAGTAQNGPAYGCLGTQPNPAWFFMQIANSGPMSIAMSAAQDIDFICWGPFPNLGGACNNLTSSNIQSCSYSPSPTETCTIANAVAGQFYIMLITNFSNSQQTITFNQNNSGTTGAGSTNCGFVCVVSPTVSPSVICAGQNATLTLGPNTSTAVSSFTWNGPGLNSSAGSIVVGNIQSSATFSVIGTSNAVLNGVPYTGTCQAAVTVTVIQYPNYSITPTTHTICQGTSFNAGVTFIPSGNPLNYNYHWYSPSATGTLWQPFAQNTTITPPLSPPGLSVTTHVYSVTVVPNNTVVSCPVTKTLAVTINNPPKPIFTIPPRLCDVSSPIQLSATPGGGTWSANPGVSASGIFTPSNAIAGSVNTVSYTVGVGSCNVVDTLQISVSRFYSPALTTPTLNMICEQDAPFNLMNIVQNTLTGIWSGTNVIGNSFNPGTLPTGTYALTYSTNSLPVATVCPAYTVFVVSVFNPPTPTISLITPTCTNGNTVTLNANPPGGLWSGAQGVSPSGVQTPSLNAIGSNTVIYAAGIGTCVASVSRIFHVSQFNTAGLSGFIPDQCASGSPFNLMSIVQNTNGSWSGLGTYGSNLFNPANLPTHTYSLTYQTQSYPNPNLCPDVSKITVNVLNPQVPIIKPIGPVCSTGSPVQLTVTPAIGYWVTSSYVSATGLFTPSLSPIGNNAVQYVIGTSTCNAKQTLLVSTEAFVPAGIISKLADQCTTSPQIDLTPLTSNNLGQWSGPGIVGSYFNPALCAAGTHIITYKTGSIPSGLCPDKSTMSVNVFSLATPYITDIGPFCNKSEPAQLLVSPVGGLFSSGVVNAVTSGGVFNPAMAMIGDNIVSYSVSSGPCIAYTLKHISVERFVSADFANYGKIAYCVNDAPFNLFSLVQNPGGVFGGTGVTGNMFNPKKANPGINTVTYQTHSDPSALLCPDTKTISLIVKDLPQAAVSSSSYDGCAPLEIVLNSTTTADGPMSWTFGDGTDLEDNAMATHTFKSPGSYTVVFNYADNEARGCSTQVATKEIKVYEMPKADFIVYPDEELSIANPEAELKNTSTTLSDNRYTWTIVGLNQRYEVSPVVYFPTVGSYRVTLTATSLNGCKDEMTRMVNVKNEFSVYIPNSFTPNYDGLNDTFRPSFSFYGLDTEHYTLEIFDRWGHLLFSTNDYLRGWDGTVQNKGQEPLKEDTYIYKLRYRDTDGHSYEKIGDVTLLK